MRTQSLARMCLAVALGISAGCADSPEPGPSGLGPAVRRIVPGSGSIAGATRVSIYGSGFKAGAMVTLNGAATDVIVIDSHGITASTAAAAPGIVDVVVTNPDGQSGRLTGGYTYLTTTGIAKELRISGPASLAPGATGQFTAVASYDDGSSHDVTSTVQWFSSSSTRVAIGAGGLATAQSRGEANVVASLNQLFSHNLNVLVLNAGEFRLTGKVTTSGRPVSNAVVEVVAGVGAGIQSFAGPSYALYGVAGDIEVRVSAYGYHSQTRTVTLSDHAVADFDLLPTNGVDKVAGFYALTVSASPVCRDLLPERFRERRFDVIITDDSSGIWVTFKSPTLIETDGEWVFSATFAGPSLRLDLEPRLLEQLADAGFALTGRMDLTFADPEIRGTFNGKFQVYDRTGRVVAAASCQDASHVVLLRRHQAQTAASRR